MLEETWESKSSAIDSYFLAQWRQISEKHPPMALNQVLSDDVFRPFVIIFQTNYPAPSNRTVFYFEFVHKNPQIAIGFHTLKNREHCREPDAWEYSYDGHISCGYNTEDVFGPTFKAGDTIGAGINYVTEQFFFTKNGVLIQSVHKQVNANGPVYPTVTTTSPQGYYPRLSFKDMQAYHRRVIEEGRISVNFGQTPFVFDVKMYVAEQRAKYHLQIKNLTIRHYADSYGIIRSYLQHYGYKETLKLFDIAVESSISLVQENCDNVEDSSLYGLENRSIIRQLIQSGDIEGSFSELEKWYPQITQDQTSAVCLLLHCQNFIELIRHGKLDEAKRYGRSEFDKFKDLAWSSDLVKSCEALVMYDEPPSSVRYLLGESQRELVADAVNAMVISTNPNITDVTFCTQSRLERLLSEARSWIMNARCHGPLILTQPLASFPWVGEVRKTKTLAQIGLGPSWSNCIVVGRGRWW
ncbi:hypothetical protein ABFX02_03G010700 [Erythranthe guttata]